MGELKDLYEKDGNVIALDTVAFIYYIEQHPNYINMLRPFFDAVDRGHITIVTSVITLVETLVLPLRKNEMKLATRYREILLNTKGLTTFALTQNIAEEAAQLRASYNLRTPDAIQLATAIQASASAFITNDIQLRKVPTMQVVVLDDLK